MHLRQRRFFLHASAAGFDSTDNQNNKRKRKPNMALNVKPLGDRILVEAVEEKEVKKGGIIIPDSAKEKPMESIVVALGTGKTDDNGKKNCLRSQEGRPRACEQVRRH